MNFLKGDSNRTLKAKKNIIASFIIKGVDSVVYLLLVPVTLGYLNPYEYGIWLTLNSILMWINSFDIGLGNGLRNNLAIAIAQKDTLKGRGYVSTTFFMLAIIMSVLICIGIFTAKFINWYEILNTNISQVPHLSEIVLVSFCIFCTTFVFKFIGNVYLALQLPAINNLLVSSGHLLSLIIIYILTLTTNGSLMNVAIAYTGSSLIIYLISYPITFYGKYKWLRPSVYNFQIKYLKSLLNLGVKFFIIQLGGVVLFALSNLVISHQFGPQEVTPYNIAYRYFSLVLLVFGIIISPIWSATTDAYQKKDYNWIRKCYITLRKIIVGMGILLSLMILLSQIVFRLWVGNEIIIPYSMCIYLAIYVLILIWSISYSNILNGLGVLRLQTINIICVTILYYPICTILGHTIGVNGIIIGMILLNLSGAILNTIQFKKIMSAHATGIWQK